MSIDIPSIVTSVCPIEKIAEALVSSSSTYISNLINKIPDQILEIKEQEKKAESEPNEEIKKKAKDRLKVQKDMLEQQKDDLQKQKDKMIEDMKKKIQEWLDAANVYAQEIVTASSAIPAAVQSYITAGVSLGVQSASMATSAVTVAAAAVVGINLADSFAAQAAVYKTAVDDYEKAEKDLKDSVARFNTAVFNVEDILSPITSIPIIGEAIKVAVMTPIDMVKGVIDVALKSIGMA